MPSEIRAEADHLRNALRTNQEVVFAGPLRSSWVLGKQVLAAGVRLASSSAELDKLFWLAEGISGASAQGQKGLQCNLSALAFHEAIAEFACRQVCQPVTDNQDLVDTRVVLRNPPGGHGRT